VLSDERIVDILSRDGVDIARRTVAKYRESLRIPSSVQRRRERRWGSEQGRRNVDVSFRRPPNVKPAGGRRGA
jgi:hypothetical protein